MITFQVKQTHTQIVFSSLELLRNAEKVPRDENNLRHIIELITYQSKTIASQAAEIKDFRNELVALKSEVNEQAKKIQTLENLQALYVQTTRYQAGENQNLHELQAKKIDGADKENPTGADKYVYILVYLNV